MKVDAEKVVRAAAKACLEDPFKSDILYGLACQRIVDADQRHRRVLPADLEVGSKPALDDARAKSSPLSPSSHRARLTLTDKSGGREHRCA